MGTIDRFAIGNVHSLTVRTETNLTPAAGLWHVGEGMDIPLEPWEGENIVASFRAHV